MEWVTIYHRILESYEGKPLEGRVTRQAYEQVWRHKDWQLHPPDDGEEE